MKKISSKTEFIIGIDFGHGETSAAYYDLRDFGKSTDIKQDLEILPGRRVIPSAVAIQQQEGCETVSVGWAAIQNAPTSSDFQVSFKKLPSQMSAIERKRMVAFMRGVYAGILDRNPDFKSRDHVVYIARPSQDKIWKSEESEYLKIAEDAGLPIAGIQKESRAAYFRARTKPNSIIDGAVKSGVLIVDFGSSTIDFTYLNNKISAPIDDGCPLGASEVEQTLLQYVFTESKDPILRLFVEKYGDKKDSSPYNQILYAFRKEKEEFYSNPEKKDFRLTLYFDDYTSTEIEQLDGSCCVKLSRKEIDSILGRYDETGYIGKIRKTVKRFKDEKLKNQHVSAVYLTGGASRMDFVRELFMDIFGLDAQHCPSDNDPSVIVSQGVAHLSYADYKTQEEASALKQEADKIISDYDWHNQICSIIIDSTKARIIEKASDLMRSYQEGQIGEWIDIKNGYSIENPKEHIVREGTSEGHVMVRNIRSLREKIRTSLDDFKYCDFVQECENKIEEDIVNQIVEKLETGLSAFEYSADDINSLKIKGLSAKITSFGVDELVNKFTQEGKGHIIYDAVSSCYLKMIGWNLYKDRWDADRKQHYDYYTQHYSQIFTPDEWERILTQEVIITGLDAAKRQTTEFINQIMEEYVSYAKLSKYF